LINLLCCSASLRRVVLVERDSPPSMYLISRGVIIKRMGYE
jgi:hypothetical protein